MIKWREGFGVAGLLKREGRGLGFAIGRLLLKRLSKMNRVKAHALRKFEEAKLHEELTVHRVSALAAAWVKLCSPFLSLMVRFANGFIRYYRRNLLS